MNEVLIRDDRIEQLQNEIIQLLSLTSSSPRISIQSDELLQKYIETKQSLLNLQKGFKTREYSLSSELKLAYTAFRKLYKESIQLRDNLK